MQISDNQAEDAECPSQDKMPFPYLCVNRNAMSTVRRQHGANLVIVIPSVITS